MHDATTGGRAPAPSAPFRRGRFEDLPERPHRPHVYDDSEALDLDVASVPFGRMRVHVRRYGSGPPLLLVHGLMTSSYSWRYAFEPLGERFACYAPDLPGAGRSDAPLGAAYTPEALGAWLGEVQRALGIFGCRAIGNSMGGYLCLHLALQEPAAMERLLNLHSPALPTPRLYALGALLRVPGSRALLRWLVRRDPLRWAHRNVHYYDESLKSLEEARAYGEPLCAPAGLEAFVKYLAETMSPRGARRLVRTLRARRRRGLPFPIPLLLVYAEQDPMVPPGTGRALARLIPDAPLIWLSQASHFAHVDATARFVDAALPFLAAGPAP